MNIIIIIILLTVWLSMCMATPNAEKITTRLFMQMAPAPLKTLLVGFPTYYPNISPDMIHVQATVFADEDKDTVTNDGKTPFRDTAVLEFTGNPTDVIALESAIVQACIICRLTHSTRHVPHYYRRASCISIPRHSVQMTLLAICYCDSPVEVPTGNTCAVKRKTSSGKCANMRIRMKSSHTRCPTLTCCGDSPQSPLTSIHAQTLAGPYAWRQRGLVVWCFWIRRRFSVFFQAR